MDSRVYSACKGSVSVNRGDAAAHFHTVVSGIERERESASANGSPHARRSADGRGGSRVRRGRGHEERAGCRALVPADQRGPASMNSPAPQRAGTTQTAQNPYCNPILPVWTDALAALTAGIGSYAESKKYHGVASITKGVSGLLWLSSPTTAQIQYCSSWQGDSILYRSATTIGNAVNIFAGFTATVSAAIYVANVFYEKHEDLEELQDLFGKLSDGSWFLGGLLNASKVVLDCYVTCNNDDNLGARKLFKIGIDACNFLSAGLNSLGAACSWAGWSLSSAAFWLVGATFSALGVVGSDCVDPAETEEDEWFDAVEMMDYPQAGSPLRTETAVAEAEPLAGYGVSIV